MPELDLLNLALTASILFAASVLQAVVGFGFAVLANPLLLLLGMSLPEIIALICASSYIQTNMAAYNLRQHLSYRAMVPWVLISWVGLLLGMWSLLQVNNLPKLELRFVVGVVILVLLLLQAGFKVKPLARVPRSWGVLAFFSSGFTGGLIGIGGPPVVIWVMAHNWDALRSRAFLLGFFVLCLPAYFVLLLYLFGTALLWPMAKALVFFPVIYLGTRWGLQLGERVDKGLLRGFVYLMLAVLALSCIYPFLTQQWLA